MALPILDGNQSATTLSSILTSGEHIPAHTVVSLGTQAITDISGAVSGSVVSISNFPATQPVSIASVTVGNTVTIAGTVTANGLAVGSVVANVFPIGVDTQFSGVRTVTDLIGYRLPVSLGDSNAVVSASLSDPLPAGTNRIGVVTIGNIQRDGDGVQTSLLTEVGSGYLLNRSFLGAGTAQIGSVTASISNSVTIGSLPLIAGTVTVGNSLTIQSGNISIEEVFGENSFVPISGTVTIGNSVTIGSLPAISGTVTANLSKGDIEGNPLFSYIVDPNNDLVFASDYPFPISGTVTVGNSVTIGSLPAISGTVTANAGGDFANSIESVFDVGNVSKKIAVQLYDDNGGAVGVPNNPLPISGTVTVGNSVTIASFATSVTARLINPAGTAVTYAEVGTAGSPSIDVLSVQGVTSGTPLTILNHQGTTVTTSNFTSTTASTVLANYNSTREVLTIFNEGAGNLHICAGATCTTIAYQVRLSAGDYYEVPLNQTSLTHSAVFATAGTARVTQVS